MYIQLKQPYLLFQPQKLFSTLSVEVEVVQKHVEWNEEFYLNYQVNKFK